MDGSPQKSQHCNNGEIGHEEEKRSTRQSTPDDQNPSTWTGYDKPEKEEEEVGTGSNLANICSKYTVSRILCNTNSVNCCNSPQKFGLKDLKDTLCGPKSAGGKGLQQSRQGESKGN